MEARREIACGIVVNMLSGCSSRVLLKVVNCFKFNLGSEKYSIRMLDIWVIVGDLLLKISAP